MLCVVRISITIGCPLCIYISLLRQASVLRRVDLNKLGDKITSPNIFSHCFSFLFSFLFETFTLLRLYAEMLMSFFFFFFLYLL